MESVVNAYFEKAEKAAHAEGIGQDAQAISLALLAVAEELNIASLRALQQAEHQAKEQKLTQSAGRATIR